MSAANSQLAEAEPRECTPGVLGVGWCCVCECFVFFGGGGGVGLEFRVQSLGFRASGFEFFFSSGFGVWGPEFGV